MILTLKQNWILMKIGMPSTKKVKTSNLHNKTIELPESSNIFI